MPITRPFGDIEHIFDDILVPVPATVEAAMDLPVDIFEQKNDVYVEALVPGVKPKDISVEVEGASLTITGKREEVRERETNEFFSHEITRGTVSRTVHLPSKVQEQRVQAWYDKGVLYLALPKRA